MASPSSTCPRRPGPSSPPPLTPPDIDAPIHTGAPAPEPRSPQVETFPIHEQDPYAGIVTRDEEVQRRFRGEVIGEEFAKDPNFDPSKYDAHHIVPLNEYPGLQPLRDKFEQWDIDLNSLNNGVALPNRSGDGTGTPHANTQNNPGYDRALRARFADVATREEALFVLGQIKQDLKDGTFIGPKDGKP